MKIDEFGCLITQDGDGADSLRFTAFHEVLYRVGGERIVAPILTERMSEYYLGKGYWRRHPDQSKWYSDPRTASRDQIIAAMRAMALSGKKKELIWSFLRILCRLGFAQNYIQNDYGPKKLPDFMLFSALECTIRGLKLYPLYPLLCLLDVGGIINALLIAYAPRWNDTTLRPVPRTTDDVDDENYITYHVHALKQMPTPISWLARRIYARTRPQNDGNIVLGYLNRVLGARAWYGRRDTPELTTLFEPIANKYFLP